MNINEIPLVSIACITFNQEKLIRNAIEGFLLQKTSFPIEIILHDDASADGTAKIIEEYTTIYSNLIVPIFQKENQYSKGINPLIEYVFPICKGKYIAFCEGDDYWIDPYKLQKQVDFLEANPEYSLIFHDALVYWENKSKSPYYFCKNLTKTTFHVNDIIKGWLIPSASMVFRKDFLYPLPSWFKEIYNVDYALQLVLILKGNFYFINKIMSIYRQNATNLAATVDGFRVNNSLVHLYVLYDSYTHNKYRKQINKKIAKLNNSINFYKVKRTFIKFPLGSCLWKHLSYIYRRFKSIFS